MKNIHYALAIAVCLATQDTYSLDFTTGRELPKEMALKQAQEAYNKAKAPLPAMRFTSPEEALKYYHEHENNIKRRAQEAIDMATADREYAFAHKQQAERENNRAAIQEAQKDIKQATHAIEIANKAIDFAATTKHSLR